MNNKEKLVERIANDGAKKVLIQLPEGLKTKAEEIENKLKEKNVEAAVCLDPCYGACDLKDREAKEMGYDLLVHIGHSKFTDSEIETIYFPWYYDREPVSILEKNKKMWEKYDNIGLIASINFCPAWKKAKKYLEKQGMEVYSAPGEKTGRGQILGCDVTAALNVKEKVDCFLYLGSGDFHVLGLALKTNKPILSLDFEDRAIEKVDFDNFVRQKKVAIEKAREKKKIGILISSKKGQMKSGLAKKIKKRLENKGKEAHLFMMDEITPEKLAGLKTSAWVNTACPRIAIEHRTDFPGPILNPDEVEGLLDKL